LILLRYFSKDVLLHTAAVSLVLLLVMLSARFVKYLASAAAGNLDTAVVFQLIFYRVPDFLQLILPLGLFVALLLVYGRLHLDNEMRVLHAAGISRFRVFLSIQVPVLLVAGLVAFISFWLSPRSLAKVETIFQQQDVRSELDALKEGRFQPFRENQGVIYAESIMDDQLLNAATVSTEGQPPQRQMKNVYIFQQERLEQNGDTQVTDVVVAAKSGRQIADERGRYLILEEGYRLKEMNDESGRIEKIEFARYGQRIESRQQSETRLETDAVASEVLRKSHRRDYQVAWQWRLSIVLLVPIVALIATALGKADPRQGRYLKILPAILLYLVYLVLLNVARNQMGSGKLPLFPGMWWVHGLFLLTGCVLFNFENWYGRFLSWYNNGSSQVAGDGTP
jgi:lipopolysaccharide export system permease protein